MRNSELQKIDITFDFTTDTPGFWDGFWENRNGLGMFNPGSDPDAKSKTLQQYNKILYTRKLPNNEDMMLSIGDKNTNYLTWKCLRFSSDTIITNFRYETYPIIWEIKKRSDDYKREFEMFIRKAYTIGGSIIFPQRESSINIQRGINQKIRDRWDLTFECIRRYYCNIESPLSKTLNEDKEFFSLFIDFKHYVEFFFLQDIVSADFNSINLWLEHDDFVKDPLPNNIESYLKLIENQLIFLEKRNARISKYIQEFSL